MDKCKVLPARNVLHALQKQIKNGQTLTAVPPRATRISAIYCKAQEQVLKAGELTDVRDMKSMLTPVLGQCVTRRQAETRKALNSVKTCDSERRGALQM